MEGSCFVENGGIRVPIGYRFRPTDEELIVHYLKPKVLATPFPASIIPEFDVFFTDPWGFPGDVDEKKRYFFGKCRKMDGLDGKCGRVSSGYWKSIGRSKVIVGCQGNQPVGIRKTMVFCRNRRVRGDKTRWFVHEFRLLQTQDWAVYCLFQKRRQKKHLSKLKMTEEESSWRPDFIDFTTENEKGSETGPPRPSSCSSAVTDQDDSSNELAFLDQEASSAYANVFSSSCLRNQN